MNRFAFTLAIVVSLATAGAAHAQGARLSGTIVDPAHAAVAGVTVTAEHVDAAQRTTTMVVTDRDGRFEIRDVQPGSYTLSASRPGFETFHATLTVGAGDDVARNIELQVGSLQETITVTSSDTPEPPRQAPVPQPAPAPSSTVEASGTITPPKKLRDVHPVYPAALAAQGVEGMVSLIATIGTDGFVRDIQVVSSPNADFATAASNAVSQWQFTPTRLDGSPIDVRMRVAINFRK
jgi:TonB family protein